MEERGGEEGGGGGVGVVGTQKKWFKLNFHTSAFCPEDLIIRKHFGLYKFTMKEKCKNITYRFKNILGNFSSSFTKFLICVNPEF